jgi:hypothetical protein
MIRPEGMSRPVGTAMSRPEMAMPGTDMICKPEGMSRRVGTAMQTMPGTDMIRFMIRLEGTSRPVGTAMQTEPGTDILCGMIRPKGTSRPEGTAMLTKPGTAITAPKLPSEHGHEPPRRRRFAMKAPSCRRDAAIPLYSSCLRIYLMCTTGVLPSLLCTRCFVFRR